MRQRSMNQQSHDGMRYSAEKLLNLVLAMQGDKVLIVGGFFPTQTFEILFHHSNEYQKILDLLILGMQNYGSMLVLQITNQTTAKIDKENKSILQVMVKNLYGITLGDGKWKSASVDQLQWIYQFGITITKKEDRDIVFCAF